MRAGERDSREKSKTPPSGNDEGRSHSLAQSPRAARRRYNFRRQHPVGPYIADFAIPPGKLMVEVDGATHDSPGEIEHDRKRDEYLRTQGWRALRIPNLAVYENLEHVIETILSHMPPTVSPLRGDPPLPQAGEDC